MRRGDPGAVVRAKAENGQAIATLKYHQTARQFSLSIAFNDTPRVTLWGAYGFMSTYATIKPPYGD